MYNINIVCHKLLLKKENKNQRVTVYVQIEKQNEIKWMHTCNGTEIKTSCI